MSSFISNTLIFGIAVAVERLISFFLLPVLTKSISPTEYAIWAQSIVAVGVLSPLILMGFQTAIVKYFPLWASKTSERDSVLFAMVFIIMILLVIVSALSILLPDRIAILVYGQSRYKAFIPLLVAFLASEALYQFLIAILRATNRFKMISLYTILKGAWRLGVFILVLYGTKSNFYRAFLAFTLIQSLFIILMYIKDVPYIDIFKSGMYNGRKHWKEVMSFSLPLVALWITTGINNFTDRFFLIHICGLEDVAAYSAAFSLVAVSAIFYSVLGLTLFPALAQSWAKNNREDAALMVERAIQVYLIFILPFIACAAVAGKFIIVFLATDAYVVPDLVFFLLACNVGFFGLYSIGNYIVMLEGSTVKLFLLMTSTAGVNILLNALLVPHLGVIGAALAGSVSNFLLAIITIYLSRKTLFWPFPMPAFIRIVFRTCIMVGFILLFQSWVDTSNSFVQMGVLFLGGMLYLFLDSIDKRNSLLTLLMRS